IAAVSAAGPALRHELLAPEGHAAIPAVAGFDVNVDFVDEHAGLLDRKDADAAPARAVILELHPAVDLRKQRVVLAEADIETRLELATALTDENRPTGHDVAIVPLDAQPLRVRVAPVA